MTRSPMRARGMRIAVVVALLVAAVPIGLTATAGASGTPGASEIDKLGRYAVAAKDASGYARAAGLKARALDYLDPADVLAPDRLPDDFFDE